MVTLRVGAKYVSPAANALLAHGQRQGRISFKKDGSNCQPNDSTSPCDETNSQCNCDFSIVGSWKSGDYS